MRKFIYDGTLAILLSTVTLILSPSLSSSAQDDSHDMLAYVSAEDRLMLYDPRDRTETTLLENVSDFVIAQDGRVAFTTLNENDHDLYVYDPSTPALDPINVTQNPTAMNYPVGWSPDGRYLAFASFESSDSSPDTWTYQGRYFASSSEQSLYVWDGEKVTNIMPDDGLDTALGFDIDWSNDGRLAFTIYYGWSDLAPPSEIYVWDGNTTVNLSQNPEGWDNAASWSDSGQLMFYWAGSDESGIYVWDGVSFKDGSPDVDTFVRLAPELEPTYVTWTDDGFVAFEVYADTGTKELVVWDLEREAIVKQYPISSDYAYSRLADGGQVILSTQLASGIPSYYLEIENTEGEILFSTHTGEFSWSSNGYLAYCGIEEVRSRILSIWNGEETWVVARVSYRPVQWQHGQSIFSCNNG